MKFAAGDRVRVMDHWPEKAGYKVHVRTPHFLRGHEGTILRVMGKFRNPEALAFGMAGLPELPLYMVAFDRDALFPGTARGRETLTADIYENWLEAESRV
ncbi:SH3-like domain-containing protein [Sphingomonas daechungensis]|uniref:SH3-like domain-containing protein n=1 Tax=Sphingomonas daechungensis TaxID=1176646 RepID=UPI003782F97C